MKTDILIIGSGPAGLQAAIHAGRKKVRTIVVGKETGSALIGTHIENYFGTVGVVTGEALLDSGTSQVRSSGVGSIRQNVTALACNGASFIATLESGDIIEADALILATGISRKKLGIPGETAFLGKGVSYCASCDCNFYKGSMIIVVGSESEAAISAELMTKYASKVYWSAKDMDVDGSLIEKVKTAGVIILNSSPTEIKGETKVSSVLMDDGTSIEVTGVFIELGGRSSADLAMDIGLMPEIDNSIKVDRQCRTSIEGVFACGDVTGRPWQVAKAVGEGAIAGLAAADYVKGRN